MLSSINKVPGCAPKKSLKFNMRTVNVLSYNSPGGSNKSMDCNTLIEMKVGRKVECNCC